MRKLIICRRQVPVSAMIATTLIWFGLNRLDIAQAQEINSQTKEYESGTKLDLGSWNEWFTGLSKVVHRKVLFTHPFLSRWKKDAYVNLIIRITRSGEVSVTIHDQNDEKFAQDLKAAYESLAHSKHVQFPDWTKRQSIAIEGDWRRTPKGDGGVVPTTGQFEILNEPESPPP